MRGLKRAAKYLGLRRDRVAAGRMWCERTALACVPQVSREEPRARILCYHSVGTREWGVNDVTPSRFRRQIEQAVASGYRFVPAAEIARTGGRPRDLAITFDDGLRSVATNAAPILAEFGIPWTLFVVSDWADGRHTFGEGVMLGWRDIEHLAAAGACIGSHSVTHPNFGLLTKQEVARELLDSRQTIQARTGLSPTAFAIPYGQSRDWSTPATTAALHAGYELIYAQSEAGRLKGTVPRTFITRFDDEHRFRAALHGAFDRWEEWY